MQDRYLRPVCDERFPCEAFTEDTAKRAIAEQNLLVGLTSCEGWQIARGAWRLRARMLRYKLRDPKIDDATQRDLQAEWQQKRAEDREAARKLGRELSGRQKHNFDGYTAAQAAVKKAAVVADLVEKPGWKILIRKAHATAWAHDRMLQDCAPSEGAGHRAAMKALTAPAHVLQKALYLGCDAEEWFIQQASKKEQE